MNVGLNRKPLLLRLKKLTMKQTHVMVFIYEIFVNSNNGSISKGKTPYQGYTPKLPRTTTMGLLTVYLPPSSAHTR